MPGHFPAACRKNRMGVLLCRIGANLLVCARTNNKLREIWLSDINRKPIVTDTVGDDSTTAPKYSTVRGI